MDRARAAVAPDLTAPESSRRLRGFGWTPRARPLVAVVVAFGAVTAVAYVAWPIATGIAAAILFAIAVHRPGWLLALATGGFYVYFAALDMANYSPRTSTTVFYYALLSVLLAFVTVRGLPVFVGRVGAGIALTTVWLAAAIWLAAWFTWSVLILSGSETAYRFLGVFILLTIPATLALLGLSHREFGQLRSGLVVLAIGLVVADILALAVGRHAINGRFSPIESFDYINASIIPAIGAIALLSDPRREVGLWISQILVAACLITACGLAGARGAVISLAVALVMMAIVGSRRARLGVLAALAVGATVGAVGASQVGTSHLPSIRSLVGTEQASTNPAGSPGTLAPEPISSTRMRREWISESFRRFPDHPIAGHGVAQLVNTADDSRRLGTYGERIWPHNDVAEAAHALGLAGLVPFVLLGTLPLVAIVRMRKFGATSSIFLFSSGLYTFAITQSNFSGEIGTDVLLWGGGAIIIAIYADWRAALARQARDDSVIAPDRRAA